MRALSFVLTNDTDLRAALDRASQEVIGRVAHSEDYEPFVSEYHSSEVRYQSAMQTGGVAVQPGDPYTAGVDFMQRHHGDEARQYASVRYGQMFNSMISGSSTSTSTTTAPWSCCGSTTTTTSRYGSYP